MHAARLALLLSATLGLFPISAQAPPKPSPDQLQALQDLADQVKTALQQGDLGTASRLSSDLMLGIFKRLKAQESTPQEKLAKLEQAAPPSVARKPRLLWATFRESSHLPSDSGLSLDCRPANKPATVRPSSRSGQWI